MPSDSILIISGSTLRCRYFINHLAAHFRIAAILIDNVSYPHPPANSPEEQKAWEWFMDRREQYEKSALGPSDNLRPRNIAPVFRIPPGRLNSPETLCLLDRYNPGFIAIFGTGILGPAILRTYGDRMFNLHVGLTEFFRGSSCNFWPIYYLRPQYLGATIHKVEEGIDTGKVACQETIEYHEEDNEQTLSGKPLIVGTRLMVETIHRWRRNKLKFYSRQKAGRLFQKKHFTPAAVLRVKQMVHSGELKKALRSSDREPDFKMRAVFTTGV